jgi:heterodisulfide reductase subunit D
MRDGKTASTKSILYFVGCMSSYRTKSIAKATKKILDSTGTDYITLGPEEKCYGSVLLRTGQVDEARELAKSNIEMIRSKEVSTVLASCPGCYLAFTQDYPSLAGELGVKVVHTTEFLEKLMAEGKLPITGLPWRATNENGKLSTEGFPLKATYHDPCHLGRWSGIYDPPRNILKSIPQLELVEMFFNRADAWCCGAGAGVMSLSGEYAKAIASERLNQADKTGARVLVSACPFCKYNFEQAAKGREKTMEVYDVVEVVASAIESGGK